MSNEILYYDEEGNIWKDCDPCGVDMSGRRWIVATGKKKPFPSNNQREGEKVLRWVKAGARLPNDGERKAARTRDRYLELRVIKDAIVVNGYSCYGLDILEEWFAGIEWLEETTVPAQAPQTPSLPVEPSRDQLLKFCQDLKNFWNVRSIPLRHEEDELNDRLRDLLRSKKSKALPIEEVQEMPLDIKKWMKEQEKALSNEDAFGYRLGAVAMYKKVAKDLSSLRTQLSEAQKDRELFESRFNQQQAEILRLAEQLHLSEESREDCGGE